MKKKILLFIGIASGIVIGLLLYFFFQPWNVEFVMSAGKSAIYTLEVNNKSKRITPLSKITFRLGAGKYTAYLYLGNKLIREMNITLNNSLFIKTKKEMLSAPTFSEIENGQVNFYSVNKLMKVIWKMNDAQIKPVQFFIYESKQLIGKSKLNRWSGKIGKAGVKYKITPLYPGNVKGKPFTFTIPELSPVPTLTNKSTFKGIKLHEGVNDITIKNGFFVRHIRIIRDSIPPKVKVSYDFEPNGIMLNFLSNKKARFIVDTSTKKTTTVSSHIIIPYTSGATVVAIDKVGNESTPIHISIVLPPPKLKKFSYHPTGIFSAQVKKSIFETFCSFEGEKKQFRFKNWMLNITLPSSNLVGKKIKVKIWNEMGKIKSTPVELYFEDPELIHAKIFPSASETLKTGEYYVSHPIIRNTLVTEGNVTILFDKRAYISVANLKVLGGTLTLKGLPNEMWEGVMITSNNSTLSNLILKNAKVALRPQSNIWIKNVKFINNEVGILAKKVDFSCDHDSFEGNKVGILTYSSTGVLKNTTFRLNVMGVKSYYSHVYSVGSIFEFQAQSGIYGDNTNVDLKNNTFLKNTCGALIVDSQLSHFLSNKFYANAEGLRVFNSGEIGAMGNIFKDNTMAIKIFRSNFNGAFNEISKSTVGMGVANSANEKVISDFASFSNNKMDVEIEQSGSVIFRNPRMKPKKVVDGKKYKFWIDERGKKIKRGIVILK